MPQTNSRPAFLEDYVGVHVRVGQFYEKYPNGRIVTRYELAGENYVIFHTAVYRNPEDAEPSATGTAIDTINIQQSSFEKVETASVGRALAFLGFETKAGIASKEEMEKAGRTGPRAVPTRQENSSPAWACGEGKERTLRALIDWLEEAGVKRQTLGDTFEKYSGQRDPKLIEPGDADKVIAELQQLQRMQRTKK